MIQILYLGRVGYSEALALQEEVAALVGQGRLRNTLLLLEHLPVLTLGRNASRANILASDELLARRGVTIHEINRGGDVTYHGPGQLVGYPIFDLRTLKNPNGPRMGPLDFVRGMEEALIRMCLTYGVHAGRVAGLTGVWCGGTGVRGQGSGVSPTAEEDLNGQALAGGAGAKDCRDRNPRGARDHLAWVCVQPDNRFARLWPDRPLRHSRPSGDQPGGGAIARGPAE